MNALPGTAISADRPFPGLRPFAFGDRDFFFGREQQVFALYRLIERGRFVAVVGSSGSGKSSLVRAGLRRLLEEESLDAGGPTWTCQEMRPGAAPIGRLAEALAKLTDDEDVEIAAARKSRIDFRLRQSSFGMEEGLAQAPGLGDKTLLLIVDQFEELFRFGLAGPTANRSWLDQARAREEATQFVQLLLDVERRRLGNVHLLITMRSDFIGDCAHFHGLSEAVSGSQFLVPNLTRDQLEDVIRKPVEKAKAEIEPALVERLINDCGDELDQLPVLQHCLMRLWDRAGVVAQLTAKVDNAARENPTVQAAQPRHLTSELYFAIGGMAEALSQHADEVLNQLSGREIAVEQAFRALSEIDREGRAIRRALPWRRLLAETGVGEADLRQVVDRYRSDDCSFLTPSISTIPVVAEDSLVDVGHESLLRRWKKLSGETNSIDPATGLPPIGWLRAEDRGGQRYRLLLSMLESESRGSQPTLPNPKEWLRWWNTLPRTRAWAERYGGQFERARQLIDDSLAAKAHARRNTLTGAAGLALGAIAIVAIFGLWRIDDIKLQQGRLDEEALNTAKKIIDPILTGYNSGAITVKGAKALTAITEQIIPKVRDALHTPEVDLLRAELFLDEADLLTAAGRIDQARLFVTEAKQTLLKYTTLDASTPELLRPLYASSLRIGDAIFASSDPDHLQDALREYSYAMEVAQRLVALEPGKSVWLIDIAETHLKLGDVEKKMGLETLLEAIAQYHAALLIAEDLVRKYPDEMPSLRERGAAHYRIGRALMDSKSWEGAEAELRSALTDQELLVEQYPDDSSLLSNLAATHASLGLLFKARRDWSAALAEFQLGVGMQETLVQRDPSNPSWRVYLFPNYEYVASVIESIDKRDSEAIAWYRKAFQVRKDLAITDPSNIHWQWNFAVTAEYFGNRLQGLDKVNVFREAIATRKRLAKDDPKSDELQTKLFDDYLIVGDAYSAQSDVKDAHAAYSTAEKIARENLTVNPLDVAWQEKLTRASSKALGALVQPEQTVDAPN